MDEISGETLDRVIGYKEAEEDGPGSRTGMQATVAAALTPDEEAILAGKSYPRSRRAVDLSFLVPSTRAGSLGRIGEYEIVGVLGRGSMGLVLKGLDRNLVRHVAVKVQDPSLAMNRRARAKFLKEARAVAAIDDPRVVTIHKVNAVLEQPYLVMEFVPGNLREKIRAGTPLRTADVVHIAEQVALGLAAAHAKGVLHRDIKPANILLDEATRRVKISDFGLAVAGLEATAAASTHRVAGTPGYMSPEQARGEDLDARSDLFSLGCVIYAMFSGRSPFPGENVAEVLSAVCESEPEPLAFPPRCPIALGVAVLISQLLAKDRGDRPASAKEVAESLATLRATFEPNDRLPMHTVFEAEQPTEPEIEPIVPTVEIRDRIQSLDQQIEAMIQERDRLTQELEGPR